MNPAGTAAALPGADEPDNLVLQARDVHFDHSNLPLHWIPGQPVATHMINVMHLMLPGFEDWFIKVFTDTLPLIKDEKLREDVIGFIGQEAMHSQAHAGALERLREQGLDVQPFVDQIEWMLARLFGDRGLTGRARTEWIIGKIAFVAAIEHITAVLGQWAMDATALDELGADPVMVDLLRWHGAEEVEHRAVAYDLYQHLDGRYSRRVGAYSLLIPMIAWLWVIRGTRYLLAHDPELGGKVKLTPLSYLRAARKGALPTVGQLLKVVPHYLLPNYHPSHYGSTSQAVAYLAASPAALAAAQGQHKAAA